MVDTFLQSPHRAHTPRLTRLPGRDFSGDQGIEATLHHCLNCSAPDRLTKAHVVVLVARPPKVPMASERVKGNLKTRRTKEEKLKAIVAGETASAAKQIKLVKTAHTFITRHTSCSVA
jgi:hypothetical protein